MFEFKCPDCGCTEYDYMMIDLKGPENGTADGSPKPVVICECCECGLDVEFDLIAQDNID